MSPAALRIDRVAALHDDDLLDGLATLLIDAVELMVQPDTRRAGVASRLMATLEAQALASGVTLLVLDTQAQSPAEGFYRRQGWQRVGEIPGYASNARGDVHATALYFKALRRES